MASPLTLRPVCLPAGGKPRASSQPLSKSRRVVCASLKEESTDCRPNRKIVQWLATGAATAALSLTVGLAPANALFNSGDAITDPKEALATVVATQATMDALRADIVEMSKDCPAPTFSCDMSQLLKKSSGRVSGPLGRTLPALIEELGADPYLSDDVLAAMLQAEAILKSNNARVRVDWEGPVAMIKLASASLVEMLGDLEAEDVKAAAARVAECDVTVDPKAPGPLECRLVRAVYSKSLAPGIS